MGSITPQVQAVDFLWRPKVRWSGQKLAKMTKNGFLGDLLPVLRQFEYLGMLYYVIYVQRHF